MYTYVWVGFATPTPHTERPASSAMADAHLENDTFPRSICCIAGVLAVALPSLRRYAPDKYKPFVVHMRSIGITALDT